MTAIILSGGKASRFGSDKAFIEIEGKPLIKRQINFLKKIFENIIIVTNDPQKYEFILLRITNQSDGKCPPSLKLRRDFSEALAKENFVEYSRRNNSPKPTLMFPIGKAKENRDIKIVEDIVKDRGPLAGIYSGLVNADSFYNFVFSCDMPFLNADLIKYMISIKDGFDAVVPKLIKGYETLFAIYSKNCILPISECLSANNLRVSTFFDRIKLKELNEKEISEFGKPEVLFMNINTKEDLARLGDGNV